jgi:peptide/nickel transport system substrate-binding protein
MTPVGGLSVAAIHPWTRRILASALAVGLAASACEPGPTPGPSAAPTATPQPRATEQPTVAPSPSAAPQTGGTIYLLMENQQFDQVDPQRIYTAEDQAFFGATIYRSLESYVSSADPIAGTTLTPDLATDLGTPTDGGRTWTFTLRDGVTFEDGSAIRCADLAYGVSRTFATDVINQGPIYAIEDLDIPTTTDGASQYPGPYMATPKQQALFDRAVTCSRDQRTITFHLNRAIGDFNYVTSIGMSPVPKAADTGETYGTETPPVSSGPYRVESYKTGHGGSLVLVRNEHWNAASDPIRKAYPDRWQVEFGLDGKVVDQRLMASRGEDAFALQYGNVQRDDLAEIFSDPATPMAPFTGRAVTGTDPYVRYLWINVPRVPNLKLRQAMLVALDRDAYRAALGGAFFGSFADGVVKPTIGIDYAPTGIWDSFFGEAVPPTGDPALATKLVAASGQAKPVVTFKFADSPNNQLIAQTVIDLLGKAGIVVKPAPICTGYGCGLFDRDNPADFGTGGWGADWPNASTVIPPVFTKQGGWDLSDVDDPAFNAAVLDAQATVDRTAQAAKWQHLNREAVEAAWIIPTFFGLKQTLAGTKVGPVYRWPAFQSWPYGVMWVTP